MDSWARLVSNWAKRMRIRVERRGMRGYPVGTVAFYGPDDRTATKVAAAVIETEGAEARLRKWTREDLDVRLDAAIGREIEAFLSDGGARSRVVTRGIVGCPHEEGIDYPEGEVCPECPFWAGRDRWANA